MSDATARSKWSSRPSSSGSSRRSSTTSQAYATVVPSRARTACRPLSAKVRRRHGRDTATPRPIACQPRRFGRQPYFCRRGRSRRNCLVRARDLPRLLALWPHEIEDQSEAGRQHSLAKLRRALRAERRRAHAAHWSYDLNRHLGLLSAYKGEMANLGPDGGEQAQPNCTPRAGETGPG